MLEHEGHDWPESPIDLSGWPRIFGLNGKIANKSPVYLEYTSR